MKELSIEEKAKAYNGNYKAYTELINRLEDVKEAIKKQNYGTAMDILYKPYPEFQITTSTELAESEDEKIRKELLAFVIDMDCKESWIHWLERQGEQKPVQEPKIVVPLFRVGDTIRIKNSDAKYTITDISDGYYRGKGWCLDIVEGDASGDYELVERESMWSEKDEARLSVAIDCCERGGKNAIGNWLKSLKDRVQPRPEQEWSEEDEKIRSSIINFICYELNYHAYIGTAGVDSARQIEWLKSLSPQNTWKPSDEQMEALDKTLKYFQMLNAFGETIDGLKDLEKQLKKLRE